MIGVMQEIDFFGSSGPRSSEERRKKIEQFRPDPEKRKDFVAYGKHYYDDAEYGVGYGGYKYDGRYAGSAAKMIAHYGLKPGASVLEMGCAKGFVLVEFLKQNMNVAGIDLSEYAVQNAVPEVKPFLRAGSATKLPWPDKSFDLVYCKETLPHLTETQIREAVAEAQRVAKGDNIFFEIQVGNDEEAQRLINAWDETHQTVRSADWWRSFLREAGFRGQAFFKALF